MAIYDFSEWQGNIDFGQLKGKAELVVLRVQAGSMHPDKDYAQYVAGAKANGIPFGTYAYGKYVSVADAQVEARDCYNRMDKGSSIVVLDVEEVDCPANQLVSATQAFIDYLHSQGVKKVGLYSGENFYKTHNLSAVNADFLWIANYGANDGNQHSKPSIPCDLWQYSSLASASGVVGHVDIDTLNGTKPLSYFTGVDPLVIIGCNDTPSKGQEVMNGTMTISGWFLNGGGIGTIQVLIDSETQTYAWGTYGFERKDVLQAYPQYNNANSGYHCDVDTNNLGLGDHTLTVIGYSKDNKSSLKLDSVQFKVVSPTLAVGSMATIKTTATNYVGGAVIADELKGKQLKITGVANIDKYSYSTKQYTLEGVPSPVYEQDIVESGITNGAPYPPPAPKPEPVVAKPVTSISGNTNATVTTNVNPSTSIVVDHNVSSNIIINENYSANVVVQPSANVSSNIIVNKPEQPVEAISANTIVPSANAEKTTVVLGNVSGNVTSSLAQQIEDAVMKDPQLQKSVIKKILDFFVSLFK